MCARLVRARNSTKISPNGVLYTEGGVSPTAGGAFLERLELLITTNTCFLERLSRHSISEKSISYAMIFCQFVFVTLLELKSCSIL